MRGLDKAQGDLVCLALNVKRLQPLLAGCLFISETWPEASGVLRPVPYAPTAVSRHSYPSMPPSACLELPFYGADS